MKKFKFRLEKVLQHRELIKDEKKRELMKRNLALQEAEKRLSDLEKAARSNKLETGKILTIQQVLINGLFAEKVKEDIEKQRVVINQRREEVAKALEDYIESSKEAKSLEMLKERKLQEYREYLQKEDEKFLDELSIQRGYRLKKEEVETHVENHD